jgi:hypothetical protein
MKRFNIILAAGFSIAYAMLLGLGMACLLELSTVVLFGSSVLKEYPRFIPFCYFVGLIALIAIIGLFVFNRKVSAKRNFTKMIWCGEIIGGFLLSIPMLFLWEFVFAFLQKTF